MRPETYITESSLPAAASRWLSELRRASRPRPHLRLDAARCALLVVDVNRYFCHPEGACFLPAAAAIVPNLTRLLDAWRSVDGVVAFARHGHQGPEDAGMFGRFFRSWLADDDPDAELLLDTQPVDGELVVRKSSYDAFLATELEQALRDRGVDQVLLAGVLTHMCVETTARAAFCRGFEVHVIADATASSTEQLHLGSLRSLADAVAVIHATEEVLAACSALPPSS